jgi:[histone H3]-lysine79 N-trimethyltransferase
MLSSPTPLPSSSDFDFFSPSKSSNSVASSSNNVIVKTRITHKPLLSNRTAIFQRLPQHSSSPSPDSSPLSSPPSLKKRKSTSPVSPLHREVKRLRPSADRPRKRLSKSSYKTPSRTPSRQQTLQPSPDPIYRISRSRSTSAFHAYDDDIPNKSRRWMTDEDGRVAAPSHLTSEAVVKNLLKSYKQC